MFGPLLRRPVTWLGFVSSGFSIIGPALAWNELIAPLSGFILFIVGLLLGWISLAVAIGKALGTRRLPHALHVLLGLWPAITVLFIEGAFFRYPLINDVATDLVHVPGFKAARSAELSSHFKEVTARDYPHLKTLELHEGTDAVFDRALSIASKRRNWVITRAERNAMEIEGYAITGIFRFRDDFVVRIRDGVDGVAAVDMRSRSRVGLADQGSNARRIGEFLRELSAR